MIGNILGEICIIIGIILVAMSVWYLRPGLKNKDRVALIMAIIILLLAAGSFIGAFSLFSHRITLQSMFPRVLNLDSRNCC